MEPRAVEDTRQHPRAPISWDVTVWKLSVEHVSGTQWQGESVDLSPGGAKVRFAGDLPLGTMVTLIFTPPDGGPVVSALASVVRQRRPGQGHAFAFAWLSYADLLRLKRMVKAHA